MLTTFTLAATVATPGWAHVEVSADKPQAGARDVTLTFVGEAESTTAGITSERVVLPAGLKPQDVTLARAPKGWELSPNQDGFTVAGPALPVGDDVTFAVTVAQLPPDAVTLAFKTVETYENGKVSRWIEIPTAGDQEPDNPAPVLSIRPAATPQPEPTTAAPTATTPTIATTPPPAAAPAGDDSATGAGGPLLAGFGILAVILAAVAAVAVRRRRTPR
ncbi:DUF1775 domain-containing protein [Solwaraspora sp. WMMD1047]|uniref:DUF1775 domain-containing protein n=1 Tax=Solwaraspora sp. WMMD1047 TaxID=3016102 RepID=UPI0024162EA6|nr:DUF1775 domain-containing protein [Solwaraspora sp. WMMD1047]MDG4834211.1 DUF1775 domain-containing protein [Solwaraspora sp. WMMD1047]